jgi:lactoylglutathione lyase
VSGASFPILSVADLQATKRFYESLGFVESYRFPPEGDLGYVTLDRGDATIAIRAAGAAEEDPVAYWLYVDDVDAAVDRLRRSGAPVVAEPVDQPWGERVAAVRDPAGTLVHLGTPTD